MSEPVHHNDQHVTSRATRRSRRLRAIVLGLAVTLLIAACAGPSDTSPPSATTVTIAAAADLRFALDEISAEFEADHPGTDIRISYGSSGSFYAQIENGAPFDIYFSADIDYPERLTRAGHAPEGSVRPYAVGRIVVWVLDGSPIDVERLGMAALVEPGVTKISIANPDHAPYGRAAVAAMRDAGLYDAVAGRLVLGENVSQALQFVESGAAEIGIVALSLALAPTVVDHGRYFLIPEHAHPEIDQGAVVLDRATDHDAATRFLDFVLGPTGRATLERYGFVLPGD